MYLARYPGCIAASTCAAELCYVRTLLLEMGLEQEQPTSLLVDNSGAIELTRGQTFKLRDASSLGARRGRGNGSAAAGPPPQGTMAALFGGWCL